MVNCGIFYNLQRFWGDYTILRILDRRKQLNFLYILKQNEGLQH